LNSAFESLCRRQVGFLDLDAGILGIDVFLRDRMRCKEGVVAISRDLGEVQVGLGLLHALGCLEQGLIRDGGFDFRQQVALLDLASYIDKPPLDVAADLRVDGTLNERINGSRKGEMNLGITFLWCDDQDGGDGHLLGVGLEGELRVHPADENNRDSNREHDEEKNGPEPQEAPLFLPRGSGGAPDWIVVRHGSIRIEAVVPVMLVAHAV
jgi:hypothetical protein